MTLTAELVTEIREEIANTETIGDLTKAIIKRANAGQEEGQEAFKAYVNNMTKHFPDKSKEECLDACKQNISYMVGYFDYETAKSVRTILDLPQHIFLGNATVIEY